MLIFVKVCRTLGVKQLADLTMAEVKKVEFAEIPHNIMRDCHCQPPTAVLVPINGTLQLHKMLEVRTRSPGLGFYAPGHSKSRDLPGIAPASESHHVM